MSEPDGIERDITGALFGIVRIGREVAKYHCGLSRTKLRKLGLLYSPWEKPGWKKGRP